MKKLLLALSLFPAVLACSHNSDSSSSELSYQLEENGCNTGSHSFSSLDDMCKCLQDDKYNNFCASDLRSSEFKSQNCSGTFGSVSCQ